MKPALLACLVALAASGCAAPPAGPASAPAATPFPRDAAQEARIRAILSHMTLAQKIGQMTQAEIHAITPAEVREYAIGSVLNGGGSWPLGRKDASLADWLALADAWWDAATTTGDGTRIPPIWGTDAVHGHNNVRGMTLFPHNIGLGAARDPALVERIGEAVAAQVRATGIDWTFAPTLAVVRDDRWGRTYEGFAEDPEIVAAVAGPYVTGLQGRLDPAGRPTVVATAKHFLGDGGTDHGTDQGETRASAAELLRVHGAGYGPAIAAGVQTVMASFSSWTDTGPDARDDPLAAVNAKTTGNAALLTGLLKTKMGFDGFVVSDWDAIAQVSGRDAAGRPVACTRDDCPQAINAGIDMVMVPLAWKSFIAHTIARVQSGEIAPARIDDAVTRILRVKLRAGLLRLDGPGTRPSRRPGAGDLAATTPRALARQAVRESLVLLKNDRGVLPLARGTRVLVVGSNADNLANQAGGWSLTWQGTGQANADYPNAESVLAGIRAAVGAANVTFSEDARGIDPAGFQAVVAVIGETPYAEGPGDIRGGSTLEHARRHPEDLAVLERVSGHGVPVVTVLISGRPLWVNREIDRSDAFVAAWLPGTEGGGIADLLFRGADGGGTDFRGRLAYSWPASACQTGVNRGDAGDAPLFPYGYGLTYAAPAPPRGPLDESPQPRRCDPPAAAAAEEFVVFRQVPAPGYRLEIGSPPEWHLPLGDDLDAVVATQDGRVEARTSQVDLQQDARRIRFSGEGQFQVITPTHADLAGYLAARGALAFDIVVERPPAGPVQLRLDCGPSCTGAVDVTAAIAALAPGVRATLRVPLQCFADRGADLGGIDTPFAIQTTRAFTASFANIRWLPGGADDPQALRCEASARP